jgi:GTPase SAR1 family protein
MGRCSIQIVMGPAGSGKSTYCRTLQEHAASLTGARRRHIYVANLDPAADTAYYDAAFDVKDLISVEEVMEELGLGPNGALLYTMEYLLENLDWLHDILESFQEDDYLLLDCPGQVELYTHCPVMRRLTDRLGQWGYESVVSVFCVDAAFLTDTSKFLSGSLLSLTAMISLELPHINILTKCDLMEAEEVERVLNYGSATHLWDVDQDRHSLYDVHPISDNVFNDHVDDANSNSTNNAELAARLQRLEARRRGRHRLTDAICQLLDDYSMVSFLPLNINEEESVEHVLATVDHAIQYGEDLEVRGADDDDEVQEQEVENDNDE